VKALVERLRREPAVILTFLVALFGLLAAFGFDLTKEQTGSIISLATVIVGFLIRSQVTPTVSVGAAEQNDAPGADLVAGPASALPNETPVDVVPAEEVFGEGTDLSRLAGRRDQAHHRDERGERDVNGILLTVVLVLVGLAALVYLVRVF
jgi:hypothetical protein